MAASGASGGKTSDRRAVGIECSWFCTEKPHSMTHWADNYATVGRCRTMSTQVTESRYKSTVKTKARKTNNHASFGGSLLQNNMEVEAAIELARHLDETGSHRVCTGFTPGVTNRRNRALVRSVCITRTGQFWFASNLCQVHASLPWFILSLYKVCFRTKGFSGKIPLF